MSLKSENTLMSYGQKSDFQDGGHATLNIKNFNFDETAITNCCSVPNFIKIRRFFYWDMAILRFSKWRPSAILDFKKLLFLSCSPCRHAILLPHTKFRWNWTTVYELWPKKRFSRWRPPPSWILKNSIFRHVTVIGFNIYHISSTSDDFSLRYGDFTIFKMAAVRHLGF